VGSCGWLQRVVERKARVVGAKIYSSLRKERLREVKVGRHGEVRGWHRSTGDAEVGLKVFTDLKLYSSRVQIVVLREPQWMRQEKANLATGSESHKPRNDIQEERDTFTFNKPIIPTPFPARSLPHT
jgi:hypothetical protein